MKKRETRRTTPKKKKSDASLPKPKKTARTLRRAAPERAPEAAPAAPAPAAPAPEPRADAFPIVGIGASAGGLEALEAFLQAVPTGSGMAYVIIQHLDPTHKATTVDLLQRRSAMPIVEVVDRQKVEPDHVYVIPPNKDMSILHGVLHLLPQTAPHGLNLPIDYFFRSLAEDQQERGIGVVLSGMGSDGSLGLRAIKEKAGAAFVQSLDDAKFSGMPRSAIEAGLADVIASAEQLPQRIVAYRRHAPHMLKPEAAPEHHQLSALEKVFILLRAHTGNDFSFYKRSTIFRRIERRMGLHQIDDLASYVRYLRENPHEVDLLFKELLIGVTSFFRDPPMWDRLTDALAEMVRTRRGVLRAWVPGCSTGEEAYSLAIVFSEVIAKVDVPSVSFQIFATDLDRDSIEKARHGVYPDNIAADVSADRLRRFFVKEERGYRVRKEIRDAVVFAPQNVIADPPFTKLDVLSCRNLLIYLAPEMQKKLVPLFHYALGPGGILFLGSAETVGTYGNLFTPLDSKSRIYRRQDTAVSPLVEFPPPFALPAATPQTQTAEPPLKMTTPNMPVLIERAIAQYFAPAVVVTNANGDILYISGRTGKFLEPPVGKANLNVYAMAREGLRSELTTAFAKALRDEQPVTVRGVHVKSDGSRSVVDLTVRKLVAPKELRGAVMIAFADAPAEAPAGKARRASTSRHVVQLEKELQHAREELQSTREQMQTSEEELKATNEELQSTNEELQSTNEELTTSKEEMQSMNEELQTVNHELQSKVDELSRANNDMKNLLNSTDIATLFLDGELLVRRFTTQASKLIKLIPADMGRPITDIATDLEYPDLAEDAREVLRTLAFKEKQVASRDGRWFMVRILPYRTQENVIDGVVITFTDATASKRLEQTLKEQASTATQISEALPNLVWECRPDGACDHVSAQWVRYTGVGDLEQLGYGWINQFHPDDRDRVREEWNAAVQAKKSLETELRIRDSNGTHRWFKAFAVPIRDEAGALTAWYWTCIDVDELKRPADERRQSAERLSSIIELVDEGIVALDDELRVTHVNAAAEEILGRARDAVVGKKSLDGVFERDELRAAVRERRASTVQLDSYAVHVIPHEHGVSLVWKPRPPGRTAGGEPS